MPVMIIDGDGTLADMFAAFALLPIHTCSA
jgi:hypothetical protein